VQERRHPFASRALRVQPAMQPLELPDSIFLVWRAWQFGLCLSPSSVPLPRCAITSRTTGERCPVVLPDPFGDHAWVCPQRTRVEEHNCLRDALAAVCRQIGLQVRVEPLDYAWAKRPDLEVSGLPGPPRVIDVSIRALTTTASTVRDVIVTEAEREKIAAYPLRDERGGRYHSVTVVPFVLTSHGTLGEHASRFLSSLRALAPSQSTYIMDFMSIAVGRIIARRTALPFLACEQSRAQLNPPVSAADEAFA
jgi:hypothetical protein